MKENKKMKENRKIRRCLLPAVLAAVAALTVSCTEYLEKEAPAPEAGSDGSVVFNAMLGDMKVAVPTRASGKAKGFENFEDFKSNTHSHYSPLVPILIRQWRKPKGSDAWTCTDALYTDKSTVAGSLAPFPADTSFSKYFSPNIPLRDSKGDPKVDYNPFPNAESMLRPLAWGGAEDESCFSAWTPVVRTYYMNDYSPEHVEDWVYMDPQPTDNGNGKEYGTVKFFRWTLDGGSSTRLMDTLFVGWSGNSLASLDNFIGISGQVIDEAEDTDVRHTHAPRMIGNTGGVAVNPPLTYETNGASVSMRFQHLVSYINIASITVIKSDGDVVPLETHWAAVVKFPNLPRYARFTTGDPTTGEAPHLLLTDEEKQQDPHNGDKSYLRQIFTDKVTPRNNSVNTKEGWFADEYTSIVERTGLASYCREYMYISPFNLSDNELGEFVVDVVANVNEGSPDYANYKDYKYYKWDGDPNKDGSDQWANRTYTIDARYYGNLSSIAREIESKKIAMGYDPASPWLRWLEAGEGLKLNLQLADGKVTGITVSIEGWGGASGSETESHSRTGIFSVNDLNDLYDNYWNKDPDYSLPDGLADQENHIYLYDDLDFVKEDQLEVKMRDDDYRLYGQGHVITCDNFHERSSHYNKGHIFDLFIEAENGSPDSDKNRSGKYTIFWYDFEGNLWTFDNWDDAFLKRDELLAKQEGGGA